MKNLQKFAPYAHWLLRIAVAAVFLYHGLPKLTKVQLMAQALQLPVILVILAALAETVGSILVLWGGLGKDWATRTGALLLVPVMLVVILRYHWGQWSFVPSMTHRMGGMEFQVVLLAIALYLLIKGNET